MKISLEGDKIIAENAIYANSFLQRAVGLLGRSSMEGFDALIIPKCKSVHMFGMRFSIDVLFCNEQNEIVKIAAELKPWRMTKYTPSASYVVELPVGSVSRLSIKTGEKLLIK